MTKCLFIDQQQCQAEAVWAIYPMDAPSHMWTESCAAHIHEMLSGSERGFVVYPVEVIEGAGTMVGQS